MFINSDASFERGLAGLAYTSAVLGHGAMVRMAECSTEAELMALRMAMAAALGFGAKRVTFRVDATSAAQPEKIRADRLQPICKEILTYLSFHDYWMLEHVPRRSNAQPNALAYRALRKVQPKRKK